MSSGLFSLGRWVVGARRLVIVMWLALLVAVVAAAALFGQGLDRDITIPGTESQNALDSLARTFPEVSGTSAQIVVIAAEGNSVTDEVYRGAVAAAVADLEDLSQVETVVSPFGSDVDGAISDDGEAAVITVQMTGNLGTVTTATEDELTAVSTELESALPDGAQTSLGGQLFSIVLPGVTITEALGVVIALVVLVITFGSMLAAGMPLIIALLGVAVSTALVFVATAFTSINSTTPVLSLMLGLAVGIDYSLFIISRHREQLAAGMPVTDSIPQAIATSGSAVVFAGVTVILALLGLSVAGIPFLTTMGAAAAAGVAVAVFASLTFLPALMAAAGTRLIPNPRPKRQRRRQPHAGAQTEGSWVDRFYRGWVRMATRRPVVTIVTIVVLLAAATVPAFGLRLALPNAGTLPADNEARQAYDLIADHFGEGYNAALIVTGSVLQSDDPAALMDDLGDDIAQLDGVASVPLSTPNASGDTGIVQIIPTGAPTSTETGDLVAELRGLHDHFLEEYGIDISVTGQTAVQIDISDKLGAALVPFGLLVVGMSLILLLMVLRSIWVPIKATLGYVLSVGVAFGAVTVVFEYGFLADVLHVATLGPVISFMPIIVMGVLFGLAMDYELFLVSRIREEYVHGASAREAIENGFLGSARVVTAAALIMFAIFASFIPEGDTTIKPMALALAVGVVVDAFVVRMTLVPAVLKLLGDRAWWMPARLARRLPVLDVEGEGISRELALSDWPTPDNGGVLAAADVPAVTPDPAGPPLWSTTVHTGETHLLESDDRVAASSILLAATGRLRIDDGRLKVFGFLLPTQAGKVRSISAHLSLPEYLDPVVAVTAVLSGHAKLLAVDGLDELPAASRAAVIDALEHRSNNVTVLVATSDASAMSSHISAPLSVSTLTYPVPATQEQFA